MLRAEQLYGGRGKSTLELSPPLSPHRMRAIMEASSLSLRLMEVPSPSLSSRALIDSVQAPSKSNLKDINRHKKTVLTPHVENSAKKS